MVVMTMTISHPMGVSALSSIALTNPGNNPKSSFGKGGRPSFEESPNKEAITPTTTVTSSSSSPWRVVMDLGREPLSRMPFEWARSGCRMPLAIPCDFARTSTSSTTEQQVIQPRSETVSFTGPDGAVVKPIQGGTWTLNDPQQPTEINFSLTFPETMARRDVTIEGGSTLLLTGRVYTQDEFNQLNQAYLDAREATWQVGKELNDMVQRQGAAKKWNEDTQSWEKRYRAENPWQAAQKRVQYWQRKQEQDAKLQERPDPNTLSDRGTLPLATTVVSNDNENNQQKIYMAQGGVVRLQDVKTGRPGPVMGTWSAQPITNSPASYRGN